MIQSPALTHPKLRHGFFTREGGLSTGLFASLNCGMGSGDDIETVRRNRTEVASALEIPEPRLVTVHQIHSATAIAVTAPIDHALRPKADAMVTTIPCVALGVLTADCGPVLFADTEARVIGAAHAGWKGALTGVTGATLDAMEQLGASRARIVAVIGPTIGQGAYEVGPEFPAPFLDSDQANQHFFRPSPRKGHAMFDLPGYLAERLRREGAGTVIDLSICTYSDENRFFSYRRATHHKEPVYGRQISAIALA